jgi:hypothetical protein
MISEAKEKRILTLYGKGKSARKISIELKVSREAIQRVLLKYYPQKFESGTAILDSNENVICSKCGMSLKYNDLPIVKRRKYSYRLSYCQDCRTKQIKGVLKDNFGSWFGQRCSSLKSKAKSEGIPFDLDKKYLIDLYLDQEGKCFYTGYLLRCATGEGWSGESASVDRIIPEKGYTKGNVVLCTRRVNTMKNDMTLDEMKEWTPRWYEKLQGVLNA